MNSRLQPVVRFSARWAAICCIFLLSLITAILPAHSGVAPGALTYDKIFSPSTIGPGSTSSLIYTITNPTGTPADNMAFTNNLPAAITIQDPANAWMSNCGGAAVLSAPDGGSTITFSGGQLGVGETCTISVDVTSSTTGTHMNVSGDLTSSLGSTSDGIDDLIVDATLPGFTKAFAPSAVTLGGRSTLTLTIDNSANGSGVSNLDFTDNLPAGMEIAGPANAGTTCGTATIPPSLSAPVGGSAITLDANGTLAFPAVGAGAVCTVSVDVVATGIGMFDNTVELLADFVSAGSANATLNVNSGGALQLTKQFTDDPVAPGGTVELEFGLTNNDRNFPATAIAFTDDLTTLSPALPGLTFSSLTFNDCGGSVSGAGGTTIGFSGGTIAAEGTCTIRVSLTVPGGAVTGSHVNTTSAVSGMIDGSPAVGSTATDTLFIVDGIPLLSKEFTDDPVGAGGSVTLEFSIDNSSSVLALTDIAFTDELTTFLPFPVLVTLPPVPNPPCGAGSSLSLISLGTDRQALSLTAGNLAASGSCTFSVTVGIPAGMPAGNYPNTTSEVTALAGGAPVTGPAASDTLQVTGGALQFTKEFTDDPVAPGDPVTLEFTITNPASNPANATAIGFTDDLDAALSGLAATGLPQSNICGAGSQISGTNLLSFTGGTLAPGASCTFSVTTNVPGGAATGTYTNTTSNLTATVGGVSSTTPPASADVLVTGMTFTKDFLNDPVVAGDTVTLRFTLDNTRGAAADITSFTDNLAANLPGLAATGAPSLDTCGGSMSGTTSLTYIGGAVAAGATCMIEVDVLVPPGATSGSYANVTSVLSVVIGGVPAFLPPATAVLEVDSTRLQLSKSFTDDPVGPGGTVTLEFTLTNLDGAQTASAIGFTDDLGATLTGLTFDSVLFDDCGGTVAGTGTDLITVSGVSLGVSGTCTIRTSLSVPAGAAPGVHTNTTSSVTGMIGGFPVVGDPASDDLEVSSIVPPSFSKAFDGPSTAGGTPQLTFTITNNDPTNPISDLAFNDDLDAVISGLVATGFTNSCGGTVAGTSLITFSGGTVAAAGNCVIVADLLVPAAASAGAFPNTTSDLTVLGLKVADPATANLVIEPPPAFSKSFAPNPILTGGTTTLSFLIDNSASALAASTLDFTDTLPAAITVATPSNASITCSGGILTAANGGGTISYSGGTVGAGASCTVTVDVVASLAGAHVNTTGDLTSSSGNSGTATDTLNVTDLPPIFAKAFSPSSILTGETSTLAFTIDNTAATTAATALDFTDNLPAAVTIATPSNASTTCTGGTLTAADGSGTISYSGGTVGGSASCTISVDVTSSTPGAHVNTTGDLTSSAGNSGQASDTLTVADPSVDLTVTLSDDIDPIVAGNTLTYTATVANAGPQDATNTVATVTLPAGVTFLATTGCAEDPAGVPTCSLGTVASGGNAVFTIAVLVDVTTSGVISNTVSATSGITDANPGDNSATEQTTVTAAMGTITIVKNTAPAVAGDGTFTFSSPDPDFNGVSLTTVGGTASTAAISKSAGSYVITEDIIAGWNLSTIECAGDTDTGSVVDLPNRQVTIDLDHNEAIVCTFTNVRDEQAVIQHTQAVIMEFMEGRADRLTASSPNLVARLRDRMNNGKNAGSLRGTANELTSNFAFTTSLSQVQSWRQNLVGGVVQAEPAKFDIWMEAHFAHTKTDTSKDHFGIVYLGADYLINTDLLVGGIIQLDWAGTDIPTPLSATGVATVDGVGWMAGPYFVARAWENVYFDGRFAWGQSYNDVNPFGTYTDGFDTDRWLVSGRVTGDFRRDNWRISPAAELIYFHETQKAYVDSLGITIPSQSLDLGRVIFGPEIAYTMEMEDGSSLTPSIKVEGIWDFHRSGSATSSRFTTTDDVRARVNLGLGYTSSGGMTIMAEGFYDGIGASGYDSYGGKVKISVPIN